MIKSGARRNLKECLVRILNYFLRYVLSCPLPPTSSSSSSSFLLERKRTTYTLGVHFYYNSFCLVHWFPSDTWPQVLVGTIRNEIADCSEKAYPSLPISNAKNLLFLDSEGAVVEFARGRGWILRDGRIYFPEHDQAQVDQAPGQEKDISTSSGAIIQNSIGYARELETIV